MAAVLSHDGYYGHSRAIRLRWPKCQIETLLREAHWNIKARAAVKGEDNHPGCSQQRSDLDV